MTPTRSIHTMGVMGHMIVINSGFLPGTTMLLCRLISKINVKREKIKSVNACAWNGYFLQLTNLRERERPEPELDNLMFRPKSHSVQELDEMCISNFSTAVLSTAHLPLFLE